MAGKIIVSYILIHGFPAFVYLKMLFQLHRLCNSKWEDDNE